MFLWPICQDYRNSSDTYCSLKHVFAFHPLSIQGDKAKKNEIRILELE